MRIILLIFISLQSLSILIAQDENAPNDHEESIIEEYLTANRIRTSFVISIPVGAHKRQNTEIGFGIGIQYLRKLFSENNIFYGIKYENYRFHSRGINYIEPDPLGDYELRQVSIIKKINYSPVVRYEAPLFEFFTPYVDAHAGIKRLITKTNITDVEQSEIIETWREQEDTVINYGATLGFEYQFKNNPSIGFGLSLSYQSTTSGSYHVETGNYELNDPYWPVEYFELKNSTADVINCNFNFNIFF